MCMKMSALYYECVNGMCFYANIFLNEQHHFLDIMYTKCVSMGQPQWTDLGSIIRPV
jgi:hypothetical protein